MKVKIEHLTELLWNNLNGGTPGDDASRSKQEVALAVRIAAASLVKNWWYQKNTGGEFTDTVTTSEVEYEIAKETIGNRNFLDVADKGILELPNARGVTRVALKDEPFKDLPYQTHPSICLRNTISWLLRGDKIYLLTDDDMKIPCDFLVTIILAEEIPQELGAEVMQMATGLLQSNPKDYTNNTNAEV